MIKLRDYQQIASDYTIGYIKRGGKRGLIVMATGTGKSIVIANLAQRLLKANDINILVATHVAELVEQNAKKMQMLEPNLDIGIYSAGLGEKRLGNKITYAGIQSIYKQDVDKVHVLIIDEAHTISRKDVSMWATLIDNLLAKNPNLVIIGLSATPFRLDSGSLTSGEGAMFNDIIYDYGMSQAIQDGWLVGLTAKHTETQFDISNVGKVAGDFNLKELQAATNIDALTKKAVNEAIKKCVGRKSWLVFCNGVEHSFAVRDELRRQGISSETVTGETLDFERADILDRFKKGEIKAVTNNAVWTTGVDAPNIDAIIMLRHTLSGGLLVQMAGRGTRPIIYLNSYATGLERRQAIAKSEKPNCLFLDYANNIERHGFIDQIKAKEKGKKGDGIAPIKYCEECFSICHASAKYCPDCGYQFPENKTLNINSNSYTGNILNTGEWREVVDIEYLPHNMRKEGKTPCLRVKYTLAEGDSISEYICLMHQGFAKQKAMVWWVKMGGGDINGIGLELICDVSCQVLRKPTRIFVTKEGKYDRIENYDFTKLEIKEELSVLEMIEDIPFM